jgi:hypothetical protein
MSEKIFYIGLNKTGTISLVFALKKLGYPAKKILHDDNKVKEEIKKWERNKKQSIFMEDLMEEYNLITDGLFFLGKDIVRLYDYYPDAKYIYAYREMEDWIQSKIIHILHNRACRPEESWREIDTMAWTNNWITYHNTVMSFYKDKSNCLVIDVTKGFTWDQLCPFLGKDRPAYPDHQFPVVHTGWEKLMELTAHYNGKCEKMRSLA